MWHVAFIRPFSRFLLIREPLDMSSALLSQLFQPVVDLTFNVQLAKKVVFAVQTFEIDSHITLTYA